MFRIFSDASYHFCQKYKEAKKDVFRTRRRFILVRTRKIAIYLRRIRNYSNACSFNEGINAGHIKLSRDNAPRSLHV